MAHAEASQIFNRQNKRAAAGPVTQWKIGVTGLAATLAIAGAIFAFASAADARPNYVTASKPCGSCHPPNRPPKKK
jgi:hypothetical protein